MKLFKLSAFSPLARQWPAYSREKLIADLIAGLIVAVMLVPQAMAYAMLAGLPPQVGLYASIVPLFAYSLFGSSNYLAVGPVAMVSLLVMSGVGQLATPGSAEFISLCLTLALLVGMIQILMGAFRLGFLVNFISHPVLVGFTSAAAIVIAFSQAKHLLGVEVESGESPALMIAGVFSSFAQTHVATLVLSGASLSILLLSGFGLPPTLTRFGWSKSLVANLSKLGPLFAVVSMAVVVYVGQLDGKLGIKVVGAIPRGLPDLSLPDLSLNTIRSLLPLAVIITLVGYMESISVAKSLAGRERERVDPNQELFALGIADLLAAFTSGYAITGGFSRSMVNYSAGGKTPLSSMFTATLVAISVLFLTPIFFYIPKAVLAAIIVVAVVPLIDYRAPWKLWQVSRYDAIALLVTFAAVLTLGIETGILVGVTATVLILVWKMSRPHIAEVGRVGNSEHFRNRERHEVKLEQGLLAFRFDASLTFANSSYLESYVLAQLANRPALTDVLFIASGVNDLDATGLEMLQTLQETLEEAGVGFYLSDVKGPVMDRLKQSTIGSEFLNGHVFLSADLAFQRIAEARQQDSRDVD